MSHNLTRKGNNKPNFFDVSTEHIIISTVNRDEVPLRSIKKITFSTWIKEQIIWDHG